MSLVLNKKIILNQKLEHLGWPYSEVEDPNAVVESKYHLTPLSWLINDFFVYEEEGQLSEALDVLEALLEAGANPNQLDKYGRNSLAELVFTPPGSEKTIEKMITLLQRFGADINQPDQDGMTPLLLCTHVRPLLPLLTCLINHGADVDHKNHAQEDLLLCLKKERDTELLDVIDFVEAYMAHRQKTQLNTSLPSSPLSVPSRLRHL